MQKYTLRYWIDDGWYVGQLAEVPEVISQAITLEELQENIKDAFAMVMELEPVESTKP